MSVGSDILWYKRPAQKWVEALPLGNGSLGAMLFGGTQTESVYLNLDTLWSGYPHKFTVENKTENFRHARDLIFADKPLECQEYIEQNFTGDDCEWYLQLGKLIISSQNKLCARKYRRQLDISTAVSGCKFTADSTEYEREAFVSSPDAVFVYSFTATGKNKLNFKAMINNELKHTVSTDGNTYTLCGVCPSSLTPGNFDKPETEYLDGDKKGISFACMFRIETDGRVKANKNHLCVSEAEKAVIYLTAADNFVSWDAPLPSGGDYIRKCAARLENAVSLGYEALKRKARRRL